MDEHSANLIRSGGLETFVKRLKKEWKHSFWILDQEGQCLYSAGMPTGKNLEQRINPKGDYFFDAEKEILGCRVSVEYSALLLLLRPIREETPELQKRMREYRQDLLICCRLMDVQRKRMIQREQDVIDVLFGRRTGIEQFLESSVLKAVEDYPYVVQLIFSRSPEPREKFDHVAQMLEKYMKEKGIPFLRPVYWREHLVHIMPALYERQSFEISLKWPERSISEEFRQKAEEAFHIRLAIGIGNSYSLKSLYRSYDEACLACRFRWKETEGGYVQRFCDLGYFVFLLSAPKEKQMNHIERWLDPIITYDHIHQTELMPLLEYLLLHTFDWKLAAKHFQVKPGTLHYRVQRIEQILGCTILGNEKVKFELFTALKLRDVLLNTHDFQQGMIGRI